LSGYRMVKLGNGQQALVAGPEKALLDLVYLQPGGDSSAYLRELRLQNLDQINTDELHRQADVFNMPKIRRAVEIIIRLTQTETAEYESL